MNEKPKLSHLLNCYSANGGGIANEMPYHSYLHHFGGGGDLYRPHQHHEDLISRHRQILAKSQLDEQARFSAAGSSTGSHPLPLPPPDMSASSNYTIPASLTPIGTPQELLHHHHHHHHGHHSPLCSHHSIHFYDDMSSNYSEYKLQPPSQHLQAKPQPPFFNRLVRTVARHFLSDERDRKYYADMYSCMPPPVFILTITFIEVKLRCLFAQMSTFAFVYLAAYILHILHHHKSSASHNKRANSDRQSFHLPTGPQEWSVAFCVVHGATRWVCKPKVECAW